LPQSETVNRDFGEQEATANKRFSFFFERVNMKKFLVIALLLAIGCGAPTPPPIAVVGDERFEMVSHQTFNLSVRPFGVTVLRDKQTKKEVTVFVTYGGGVTVTNIP
jgi:hypothetical protein